MSNSQSRTYPVFTIWLYPRRTIRAILDTNPKRHVVLLAALGGIATSADSAIGRRFGDFLSPPAIAVLVFIIAPIGGVLTLYIGGWLLRITCSWLGGTASQTSVRAALAWSNIPQIVSALVTIPPSLIIHRSELFSSATPSLDALIQSSSSLALVTTFVLLAIGVVSLIMAVWSILITVKCVAEAHRFSAWRALFAFLLAGCLVAIPIAIIVAVASGVVWRHPYFRPPIAN